jgi:TonB family protein
MNDLTTILIESGISLAVFYLIYLVFLKKDTYFNRNRTFLTASILLSVIIPLIRIPLSSAPVALEPFIQLDELLIRANSSTPSEALSNIVTQNRLLSVYFAGVVIYLLVFFFRILQLGLWALKYEKGNYGNAKIISVKKDISPFSFFNWIFLPENKENDSGKDEIIFHEMIHVKQLHSFDIILTELLIAFQWFNPFAWLYRISLKEIHEYIADSKVLQKGYDSKNYMQLILNEIFGIQYFTMGSYFNNSIIKNRMIMMTKNKSSIFSNLKLLAIPPVVIALMLAFSCTKKEEKKVLKPDNSTEQIKTIEADDEGEIFFIVEEMPDFQGKKEDGFRQYIADNLKYPEIAVENGISGKVFIRFIIEKNGSLSHAEVVRGVDPALDAEALRVVKSSPKWKPGKQRGQEVRVSYTFPINFVLQ